MRVYLPTWERVRECLCERVSESVRDCVRVCMRVCERVCERVGLREETLKKIHKNVFSEE